MKLQRVLFIGLFWLLTAGSSYGGGFGAPAFDAYVFRSTIWPAAADGIHEIPVCWLDFDDSTEQERNWVRDAVRRTWESVSLARFTGWEECTVPAANFDGVAIEVGAGVIPHTDFLGNHIAVLPPPHSHGLVMNFTDLQAFCNLEQISGQRCIEGIAVHEFGHVLGFDHEQAREDADPDAERIFNGRIDHCGDRNEKGQLVIPDFRRGPAGDRYLASEPVFVGPWDQDSVMNYCKENPNHDVTLSRMDAYAARAFYGNTAQYSNDTRIAQLPVVIAGGRRYVASLEPAGGNRWRVTGLRRTRENSVLPARYANGTLTVPFVAVYQEQDVAGRTQNNLVAFYSANLRRGRDGLFTLISYRLLPGQ